MLPLLSRLHEHRAWVNRKLLAAAREIDPAALRRPLAIGQGSIWRSLVHLYAAEYLWLETLYGDDNPLLPGDVPGKAPGNQEASVMIATLDELDQKWSELEARWVKYLNQLTTEQLDDTVFKVSSFTGVRQATRRSDILLHVCTHAQYTTAQVVNMLRQVGASALPDVMLITMARQQYSG
jgi:uncharacterized damage-inducible protein DinB